MMAAERGSMKRSSMKKQRRMLRGWVKWVPVVAIPFSILFFHTWLNIQILRADYVLRELDSEAREWSERLNNTGMAETIREDPNMLAEQAEQMVFVQPSPGQREMIYYDPSIPLVPPADGDFTVAQLDGASQPNPGAMEAAGDQSTLISAPAAVVVPVDTEMPVSETADVAGTAMPPVPPVASPLLPEIPETLAVTTEAPAVAESPVVTELSVVTETPVSTEAPATVVTNVVLDLPEAGAAEETVVDLESAMESLESL